MSEDYGPQPVYALIPMVEPKLILFKMLRKRNVDAFPGIPHWFIGTRLCVQGEMRLHEMERRLNKFEELVARHGQEPK